jgi:hypothetical protein
MSAGGRLCTFQENPHFWFPKIKVRPHDGSCQCKSLHWPGIGRKTNAVFTRSPCWARLRSRTFSKFVETYASKAKHSWSQRVIRVRVDGPFQGRHRNFVFMKLKRRQVSVYDLHCANEPRRNF